MSTLHAIGTIEGGNGDYNSQYQGLKIIHGQYLLGLISSHINEVIMLCQAPTDERFVLSIISSVK